MAGESSIKRAAFINMGSRYVALGIQLVYNAILSRILTPNDFGVVAIAQVFVTFFSIFSDMGLGAAIIQKRELDEDDMSHLFSFSLLMGLALGALLSAAGPLIALLYSNESLVPVCLLLAVSLVITTLNTVPNAMLMREKRFVSIGVRQVVAALFASFVGIISAVAGAGLFAITIYSIVNSLAVLLWNYLPKRIAPRFRGMWSSVRKVSSYSGWVFGFDVVNYFSRNLDNLLIGFFFGTAELGNYSKAYQLMRYPQTYLTNVVTPVLHPMLAERQKDVDYIYSVFLKSVKALSLVGVLASVLCYFCADEMIELLYGSQWGGAADCFRLLAISVWSQMVCGTSGTMFQVLNRTREQFARGVTVAVVIIASILVGVTLGSVEAVAACVGVAYYIAFATFLTALVRDAFSRSVLSFLKELMPDLAIAACLSMIMQLISALPFRGVIALIVKLVIGIAAYVVLLAALRQGKWLTALLPSRLRSKVPDIFLR